MEHHATQPRQEGDNLYPLDHVTVAVSDKTAKRLRDAYHTHGTPFAAYLLLDDTNLEDPTINETFTDVYTTTWDTIDQLIDNELDALGWSDALTELCTTHGIEPEFLTWNRPLLTSYLTEVYSIIELDGKYHVFHR